MRYRPHRGSWPASIAEMVDGIESKRQLVDAMRLRCSLLEYYPPDDRPTVENVTVEPYGNGPDKRIGWAATYIVCVKGGAWGFTDGPLP